MAASGLSFLPAPLDRAAAQQANDECVEGDLIRVLFLLDTSRSLQGNDPQGMRTSGTVDAIEDLSSIVDDYQSRLRQYYPQWSVFAAVDTFSASHDDPQYHNPYSRASGEWRNVASTTNLDVLRRAAADVQRAPGLWTDYGEALRGALERFRDPTPEGTQACDFLFWFTDGDHDTEAAGVLTDGERRQIDEMCASGGVVEQLREVKVNVTAIELRVDRESSEQLRRLVVGSGSDCLGLGGNIADVVSIGELATQIEESVFRLVDPDYPDRLDDPCGTSLAICDYRFTLADDTEWVKVYVDLAGVVDPDGVSMVLHGPDGQSVAPFEFDDEWSQVPGTGMFGKQPTPNISVIWAHRVSEQEFGTDWGDSEVWSIRFSGPGASQARAGIRKDERGQPAIGELSVEAETLSGRITPAPAVDERAVVVLYLDDGRHIDVPAADRGVAADGRFTIPNIFGRVVGATGEDDYLASNSCTAAVIVSLEKDISFGTFRGIWQAPLSNSTAEVRVPRALCGLEGRKTPVLTVVERVRADGFDPSGSFRMTADGGILNGSLAVQEVTVEIADGSVLTGEMLGSWAQDWRCEVAADRRNHTCPVPFVLELNTNLAMEVDVKLDLVSTTTDPLQAPPSSETLAYTIRGVPLEARLPVIESVEVDGKFDPSGSLSITAQGGWQDGAVTVDLGSSEMLGVSNVDGPIPQLRPAADWQCDVPAMAADYKCPPLPVAVTTEDDTIADLSISLLSTSADLEESENLSAEVIAVPIRTRTAGEALRNFLLLVAIILAVLLASRILTAWMRRRWTPIRDHSYHVATARRQGGNLVPDDEIKSAYCGELAKAGGSATLGNLARLHVRWWPLLLGGQMEIVASPAAGKKVVGSSGHGRKAQPDRGHPGRIGRTLDDGWVALEAAEGDALVLTYWDVPADGKTERASELWIEIESILQETNPDAGPPTEDESKGEATSLSQEMEHSDADSIIDPAKRRWPDPSKRSNRRDRGADR